MSKTVLALQEDCCKFRVISDIKIYNREILVNVESEGTVLKKNILNQLGRPDNNGG
jgi:hypothetical protein